MFKIGDFSKLGQVSTRMLRHYDKLGLLVPSHTDAWTSYRYYTIDQLSRLNRIIALKDLGFTLEQVADIIDDETAVSIERLQGMLAIRQAELQTELRHKQEQLASVQARLTQIEQEGQPLPYEVVVKSVQVQSVASLRQVVPHVSEMGYYCETMYRELNKRLKKLGVRPLQPEITLYHNDEFQLNDLDVETAIVIQPKHVKQPPKSETVEFRDLPAADLVAALIYEGPFREMEDAFLTLLKWIGLHDHVLAGPLRELHLSGPAHPEGVAVETAVVELQVPIAKAEK